MLRFACLTDSGKTRKRNEDALYADPNKGFFLVADGMGGHRAGDVASAISVSCIKEALAARLLKSGKPCKLLEELIKKANRKIYQTAQENARIHGMGTTIVAAVVKKGVLTIAHVGDSRAYILDHNKVLRCLVEDHTLGYRFVKQGVMTKDEAQSEQINHILTRAVGVDENVEVDTAEFPYEGEKVLLCTDGLTDMVDEPEIEDVLKKSSNADDACRRLVDLANDHGGSDNVSVLIFQR